MVEIENTIFTLNLPKLKDQNRAGQELRLVRRKIEELPGEGIILIKVILNGEIFVKSIELHYTKNEERKILELTRNEFYQLEEL